MSFLYRLPICLLLLQLIATGAYGYDNLADYEADLIKYHDTLYIPQIAAVTRPATAYILSRAPVGRGHLAVVLDIDETALSDWTEITKVVDFGYNNDLFNSWALLEESEPIRPVLDLFNRAKAAGVSIFFVSGRPEKLRQATEENLHKAGYSGWAGLCLRPADFSVPAGTKSKTSAFKTACRKSIEDHGYVIIANIGDQVSDLVGGHAEKTFKVPNPFYRIP